MCVHVSIFILRLIEEKKNENYGLFNLTIKEINAVLGTALTIAISIRSCDNHIKQLKEKKELTSV